jgi:hypothetical protein
MISIGCEGNIRVHPRILVLGFGGSFLVRSVTRNDLRFRLGR